MPVSKEIPVHIIACAGLVVRDDQVLLVHVPRRGWVFPGGQMEMGETPYQAVTREILEEAGVRARVRFLAGVWSSLSRRKGYGPWEGQTLPPIVNLDFVCEYIGGEPKISDETDDVRWASREEALSLCTSPSYHKRLEIMLESKGEPVFMEGRLNQEGEVDWRAAEDGFSEA